METLLLYSAVTFILGFTTFQMVAFIYSVSFVFASLYDKKNTYLPKDVFLLKRNNYQG